MRTKKVLIDPVTHETLQMLFNRTFRIGSSKTTLSYGLDISGLLHASRLLNIDLNYSDRKVAILKSYRFANLTAVKPDTVSELRRLWIDILGLSFKEDSDSVIDEYITVRLKNYSLLQKLLIKFLQLILGKKDHESIH